MFWERKEKFLQSNMDITKSTALGLLKKVEEFEHLFEIDASEFTKEQILIFFKSLESKSLDSINVQLYIMARYTDWCIENIISESDVNHYKEISKYDKENFILVEGKERFFGFEEMEQMSLMLRHNPVDQFMLWAPWYGIGAVRREELESITINDLDENGVLHLENGRQIILDNNFYYIFTNACTTYTYIRQDGAQVPLVGEGAWKRAINTRGNNIRTKMNSKYLRIARYVGRELNYNTIQVSAIIHTLKTEAKNQGIELETFIRISPKVEEIFDHFNYRTTVSLGRRISSFLYSYKRYF